MNCEIPQSSFPLLQQLLVEKALQPKGIYTNKDAAEIFGVSTRTIQDWVRSHRLQARDLPGRGRFLSQDLRSLCAEEIEPSTY